MSLVLSEEGLYWAFFSHEDTFLPVGVLLHFEPILEVRVCVRQLHCPCGRRILKFGHCHA